MTHMRSLIVVELLVVELLVLGGPSRKKPCGYCWLSLRKSGLHGRSVVLRAAMRKGRSVIWSRVDGAGEALGAPNPLRI